MFGVCGGLIEEGTACAGTASALFGSCGEFEVDSVFLEPLSEGLVSASSGWMLCVRDGGDV